MQIRSIFNKSIEGEKVSLRLFRKIDISSTYISWLNDSEIVRYSNQRFILHNEESCQQYLASFSEGPNVFLVINDLFTGVMLGTLTVYINSNHRTADIGIMIGCKNNWGRGIGLDAFRTVADALERSGKVRKLTAGTLAVNQAMVRIMERTGFNLEATRYGQELLEGQPVDVVYYSRFCHV